MKVVVIASIFPPPYVGGAERSLEALVGSLVDSGLTVSVIALSPHTESEVMLSNGVSVIRLPIRNIYWRWSVRQRPRRILEIAWNLIDSAPFGGERRVRKLIRRLAPDIVLTSNLTGWSLAPWRAARAEGVPVVHIVRDYSLMCVRSNMTRRGASCDSLCSRCTVRASSSKLSWPGGNVVGISQAVLDIHQENGLFRNDPSAISHPEVMNAHVGDVKRTRSGSIGYLGRLSPEKGVEALLEATRGQGYEVLIAGGGRDDYVAKLREANPHANFLGEVSATDFLSQIGILVVPSLWEEPFGRVAAEAAAFGVPVLVSSRGGLREAAESSGALYRVFDPADTESLRGLLDTFVRGTLTYERVDPDRWPSAPMVDILNALAPKAVGE